MIYLLRVSSWWLWITRLNKNFFFFLNVKSMLTVLWSVHAHTSTINCHCQVTILIFKQIKLFFSTAFIPAAPQHISNWCGGNCLRLLRSWPWIMQHESTEKVISVTDCHLRWQPCHFLTCWLFLPHSGHHSWFILNLTSLQVWVGGCLNMNYLACFSLQRFFFSLRPILIRIPFSCSHPPLILIF